MAGNKLIYGIDLGTTNSAICRMEKGEPKILRTDAHKEIMPSCVAFARRRKKDAAGGDGSAVMYVGERAYVMMKSDKRRCSKEWTPGQENSFLEFKRTMATTVKYECANAGRAFSSEELSAEVLKMLKTFAGGNGSEPISAAVVTVPARFNVNQKTATLEAANLAGIEQCELLQEPIAASMAYGIKTDEQNGTWLVFDLGGGTFDAALVRVSDGIMEPFDTDGDSWLGGKDLDYALVDSVIIPWLNDNFKIGSVLADAKKKQVLRAAMKTYAEEAKNQLSFKESFDILSNLGDLGADDNGEEIVLDLTVTREQAEAAFRPLFERAVGICKKLLSRNGLSGENLSRVILVGGPTYCPLLRRMLREQITENVDTSINPMTAVAVGAAIYASTITLKNEIALRNVPAGTVRLEIGYDSMSTQTEAFITVKLPAGAAQERVWVEAVSESGGWQSGKIEVVRGGDGEIIQANLTEKKANVFLVRTYDRAGRRLPCYPNEITILQGTEGGAATLPFNIGIAVIDLDRKKEVFEPVKGLERDRPVPVTGTLNNRKTTALLRPGVSADELIIPVYQTKEDPEKAKGTLAMLGMYVADVVITGEEVEEYVPAGSLADVTLRVDSSEQMTLSVYFQEQDFTVEKKLFTGRKMPPEEAKRLINEYLAEAERGIGRLEADTVPVDDLRDTLESLRKEALKASEEADIQGVLEHIKDFLSEIEKRDAGAEWFRAEKELKKNLEWMQEAQEEHGDSDTALTASRLKLEAADILRARNIRAAKEKSEEIYRFCRKLTQLWRCKYWLEKYNREFETIRWLSRAEARSHLDRGVKLARAGAGADELQPIVSRLWNLDLTPRGNSSDGDDDDSDSGMRRGLLN